MRQQLPIRQEGCTEWKLAEDSRTNLSGFCCQSAKKSSPCFSKTWPPCKIYMCVCVFLNIDLDTDTHTEWEKEMRECVSYPLYMVRRGLRQTAPPYSFCYTSTRIIESASTQHPLFPALIDSLVTIIIIFSSHHVSPTTIVLPSWGFVH